MLPVTNSEDLSIDVYADSAIALAVSAPLKVQDDLDQSTGFLVFTLKKNDAGQWLINDIDFEEQEGAAAEIDRFLDQYAAAQHLTAPPS